VDERLKGELALLQTYFPQLEYRDDGRWIWIPGYGVPTDLWAPEQVTVACHFQPLYPGQAPYGIWVQPGLRLKKTGQQSADHYSEPAGDIPLVGTWGKFSFSPISWRPTDDLASGDNMLNFILSFRDRLLAGT